MTNRAIFVRQLVLAGAVVAGASGCAEPAHYCQPFDHRVLPPSVTARPPQRQPQRVPGQWSSDDGVKQARADLPVAEPVPASPALGEPSPPVTDGRAVPGPLSLPEAIVLAYRLQPRLRVFLEEVVQARGTETIARAPFLPSASAGYSVG